MVSHPKAHRAIHVGIPAPSCRYGLDAVWRGIQNLKEFGFEISTGKFLRRGANYGDPYAHVEARFEELVAFLRDPAIDIVWWADGGYGGAYLLPLLFQEHSRENFLPNKVLIGFSDANMVQVFLSTLGFTVFLGPNVTLYNDNDEKDLRRAAELIATNGYAALLHGTQSLELSVDVHSVQPAVAVPWFACNFSILNTLWGSAYGPRSVHLNGGVLFLEEHGPSTPGQHEYLLWEKLQRLELTGLFSHLNGLVVGEITAEGPYADPSDMFLPMDEIFRKVVQRHPNIQTLLLNFPFGDSFMESLLPMRGRVTLHAADTMKQRIDFSW